MASIFDPENKTEKNNLGGSGEPAGLLMPQNRVAGSGRFQNLKGFIAANQGAGADIGQKLQGNIQKETETAKTGIEGAKQSALSLAGQEQQRLNATQPLFNYVSSGLKDLSNRQDQSDVEKQFGQLRQGTYQNINLGDTSGIQKTIQGVQDLANQTKTEQGRLGLIDRFLTKAPGYTRGTGTLDQLFLQASPTDVQNLTNISGQFAPELQGQLSTASQAAEAQNRMISNLAQQRQAEANKALTSGLESLKGELQGTANQVNQINKNVADIAKTAISGGTITQADYDYLKQYSPNTIVQIDALQSSQATNRRGYNLTPEALNQIIGKQYDPNDVASLREIAGQRELAREQELQKLGAEGNVIGGQAGNLYENLSSGKAGDMINLQNTLNQINENTKNYQNIDQTSIDQAYAKLNNPNINKDEFAKAIRTGGALNADQFKNIFGNAADYGAYQQLNQTGGKTYDIVASQVKQAQDILKNLETPIKTISGQKTLAYTNPRYAIIDGKLVPATQSDEYYRQRGIVSAGVRDILNAGQQHLNLLTPAKNIFDIMNTLPGTSKNLLERYYKVGDKRTAMPASGTEYAQQLGQQKPGMLQLRNQLNLR